MSDRPHRISIVSVASFSGNNFDGSILRALKTATESGAIRVVDLALIIKDAEGTVAMAEVQDQDEELKELARAIGFTDDMPLLTEDDITKLGESMANDTAAGVLVIEQLWAKELKAALLDAGAELIDEGRIRPELADAAVEDIEMANA